MEPSGVLVMAGDFDAMVDEVEEFLTGIRHGSESDRVLATVLVAGSGLRFAERGIRALKGVPGDWRLYAVEA